jgi:hypothetical protein
MMNFEEESLAWSYNEKRMLKYMLENDGMQHMRYFFKHREGAKMIRNWHHYVIEYVLQAVYDCKINRLIINIAPGYSKTEQVVINFITRGFAINPRAKFIHASYSADLAHANSFKIKDTISSKEFQDLWPMTIRADTKGKKEWYNNYGGGIRAAAAGGQITGFRSGRMVRPGGTDNPFTGALVIDDALKPDDAYSATKRNSVNNRINNTFKSRLAVDTVPIIVNGQRLADDDISGYLLKGGSGDKWYHLSIPTVLDEEAMEAPYPKEYTHGIEINTYELLRCLKEGREYAF